MKKILAVAAVLMMAAFSFADGFKNKINVGGVYSNTDVTFDNEDDTLTIKGAGINLGWRGTLSNGLTFLADLDIIPNASLGNGDDEIDDFTDCSFAFGVGKEWAYDKGCFALAGVLGDEVATKEEDDTELTISSVFVGLNVYGTYKFNDRVGIFGSLTAGFNFSGDVESEIGSYSVTTDLETGDFRIAPKIGLVIEF